MANCGGCGTEISAMRRIMGGGKCRNCYEESKRVAKEEKAAARSARHELEATLRDAALDGVITSEERRRIDQLVDATGLGPNVVELLATNIVEDLIKAAFNDDMLNASEIDQIDRTATALGISPQNLPKHRDRINHLRKIIEIESGKLPTLINPSVILKRNEAAYGEASAEYLEEKSFRQAVGHSSGVSFRVAKGVYYHRSLSRPSTVRTTQIVATDKGTLTITNQRIIYTGIRKTFSAPLSKILSFTFYADAIQVNLENRNKPHIVRVADIEVMTALCAKATELALA